MAIPATMMKLRLEESSRQTAEFEFAVRECNGED